jgi:hypothetical protein
LVAAQPWQPIAKWDLWCLTCCFVVELRGIDIDAKPERQAARHAMIHLDGLHERIFDLRGWLRKRSRWTSGWDAPSPSPSSSTTSSIGSWSTRG